MSLDRADIEKIGEKIVEITVDEQSYQVAFRTIFLAKIFQHFYENRDRVVKVTEILQIVGTRSMAPTAIKLREINAAIAPYGLKIINEHTKGYRLVGINDEDKILLVRPRTLSLGDAELTITCNERCFRVLEAVASSKEGLSANDLCELLNLKGSQKVHRSIIKLRMLLKPLGASISIETGTQVEVLYRFEMVEQ